MNGRERRREPAHVRGETVAAGARCRTCEHAVACGVRAGHAIAPDSAKSANGWAIGTATSGANPYLARP